MNRSKKIVLGIILFSFCKLSVGYSRVLTVPAENNADTVCRNAACATSSVSACTNAGSYPCCDPSGTCRSLRAAVRQAVLYEPDPTTINLAPATTSEVTYSVNCTNGTLSADDASLSGDIDLVYSGAPKPVTINGVVGAAGVSRNLITIKCINQSAGLPIGDYSIDRERVFDISGHMIVNLNNVNLESDAGTNALGNSSLGGGVTIRNGATFRMSHVLMKNNVALQGGAIYAVSGSTVLVGDTDGNEFEGNNAFGTARADGQGGAIYVNDAAVTVKKSTFIENTASFDGGAIYVANTPPSTPVNLYQSTLYNNEATKGFGGAIAVSNPGSLNIERTSVVLTKANEGGGIAQIESGVIRYRRTLLANNYIVSEGTGVKGNCYNIAAGSDLGYNGLNSDNPSYDPLDGCASIETTTVSATEYFDPPNNLHTYFVKTLELPARSTFINAGGIRLFVLVHCLQTRLENYLYKIVM